MGIYGDLIKQPEEPTTNSFTPVSQGAYGSQVNTTPLVTIDNEPYFTYDGDTLINNNTNEKIRLPNYDAGELSRVGEEFGELHLGSFVGPLQKQAINNVIREEGFNKLIEVEDQDKDKYGRKVMDLVNARGIKLSDYLQSERIVSANRYTTKQQNALRFIGDIADSVSKRGEELSSGDRARELVNSALTPYAIKDIKTTGTLEEVFRGSGLEESFLQAEINKINSKLKTTTNKKEKEQLMQELIATQEALTINVNTEPDALTRGIRDIEQLARERKPGFWGESINAAEKSIYMLSNSMGGFSAWLGDSLNNKALQDWGDDWSLETTEAIRDAGYTTDFWSIRGPYDALRFISSSIIQYTPQLASIIAAGKAGMIAGAPFGPAGAVAGAIGASTATSFILAVSSVYQGQPEGEKDPLTAAAIAMPIAIADKIGAGKVANTNFFTKQGKDEYYKIVKDELGWDKAIADKELKKGIAEVMKNTAGVLDDFASRQLIARKTFKDLAFEAGKAGAAEAFTEATQQAIEEVGLGLTTSLDIDYEQLVYNMIESGAVGGVVGGGFRLPFAAREMDSYNNYIFETLPEDENARSKISLWEEAHRANNNGVKQSKLEIASKYSYSPKESLQEMAGKAAKSSNWRDFISALGNPIRFMQQFRGFLSPSYDTAGGKANLEVQNVGDALGHLSLHDGMTPMQEFRVLDSNLNKFIPSRAAMSRDLGIKETDMYKYLSMSREELAAQGLPNTAIENIVKVKSNLDQLGIEIAREINTRRKAGAKINISDNMLSAIEKGTYFKSSKNIDYRKVDQQFKELLLGEEFGKIKFLKPGLDRFSKSKRFSSEEVDVIMNEIRNENLSIESREKLDKAGVYRPNSKYQKYLRQQPWEDLTNTVRSLAKDIVFHSRFGSKGDVLANMLESAFNKGEINEQQKYNYASMAEDFLKMNRYTYKPIKNKTIRNIQDNALFFSTLTYMDFNFFANMAEMTNGLIGLTPKQMWSYIKTTGTTFTKQLKNDLGRAGAQTLGVGKVITKRELADLEGNTDLERGVYTGLIAPKGSISSLEGVDVTIPAYKNFLNHFWAWNQVENQTNSVRAARAAQAWENIIKLLAIVNNEKSNKQGKTIITGKSRFARDRLTYYGLNVDRLSYLYAKVGQGPSETDIMRNQNLDNLTTEERIELQNIYKTGVVRFTDELIVRPEPGSTPKIIEDPHFALFTQFKRFISHFTANVIPRVYSGYIRSGKPAMTRNVFTVIVSAYAMAMLSQMIKDAIVYGEQAPWLEDDEEDPDWLRTSYSRAAAYTGWGGTPLMAVEFINDYRRNAGRMPALDAAFEAMISESPMLNTIYSDVTSKKDLGEILARRVPFAGDIKPSRETLQEIINSIGK